MNYQIISSEKKLTITVFAGIIILIVLFLSIGAVLFYNSLYKNKEMELKQSFLSSQFKIEKILESIQQKSRGIAATGERFYSQKKNNLNIDFNYEITTYLKKTITPIPYVYGSGIWYEPYVFNSEMKYYGPYSFQTKDSVSSTWLYSSENYDYFSWDWYRNALPTNWDRKHKLPKLTYWIHPFFDPVSKVTMLTVSSIMYNDSNLIIGLASVDIDLEYLSNYLKKYNSIAKADVYLIHQESAKIMANSVKKEYNSQRTHIVNYLKDISEVRTDTIYSIDKDNDKWLLYSNLEMGITVAIALDKGIINSSILPTFLYSIGTSLFLAILIALLMGRRILKITKQLRIKSLQFSKFTDNLPAIIYMKNIEHKITYSNEFLNQFYGLEHIEDLDEKNSILTELIKEFDNDKFANSNDSIAYKTMQINDKEGKPSIFDLRKFSYSYDNSLYTGCIGIDISEQEFVKKVEKAVLKISQFASKTDNMFTLYKYIHQEISEILPATNFFIAIYNSENDTFKFPYFIDDYDSNPGQIPAGKTLSAYVVRSSKPLLANKQTTDELAKNGEITVIGADSFEWLGVPLIVEKKSFGVMVLQSYTESIKITDKHKEIFMFIAEQISFVLERRNAINALKQSNIELEFRVAERTSQLSDANEELLTLLEQKEISSKLIKESEERFRNVANSAPVMIWMIDSKYDFTFINSIMIDYFGIKNDFENIYDFQKRIFIEDVRIFENALSHSMINNSEFSLEIRVLGVDKTNYKWIKIKGIPVNIQADNSIGMIGSCVDITDMKKTEVRITTALEKEKELNNIKSMFISTVSHEYKSPLTSIMTSIYLIEKSIEKNDFTNINKYIKLVTQSVHFMNSLLDDVLTMARSEAGKIDLYPEVLNLPVFISDVIEEVRAYNNDNDRIIFNDYSKMEKFIFDKKALKQILINLLTNAIKYSLDNSPVEFTLNYSENKLYLIIKDYGIGVPEKEMNKLFEPFHRAENIGKISGTGLGLSIVKKIVDHINGEIKVESQIDSGTTFEVWIPELSIE